MISVNQLHSATKFSFNYSILTLRANSNQSILSYLHIWKYGYKLNISFALQVYLLFACLLFVTPTWKGLCALSVTKQLFLLNAFIYLHECGYKCAVYVKQLYWLSCTIFVVLSVCVGNPYARTKPASVVYECKYGWSKYRIIYKSRSLEQSWYNLRTCQ